MQAKSNAAAVIAVVLPALLLDPSGATSAQAAEMDCDTLIGKLKESGEFPKISINPADETVGVVTSEGSCSESIETWSQRPPLPKTKPRSKSSTTSPAPGPPPRPRQHYLTPEPDRYPVPEPPKSSGRTAAPAQPSPAKPAACDRRLENFWNVQVTTVEGVKQWLFRVFTLDMDGDRRVDNVSFTFKEKSGAERIVHYFGVPGGISGSQMPTLKLPDDGLIKRLCFGDLSFEKPEFFGQKPLARKWIEIDKPDLAGEMEAKEKGIVYKSKGKKKKKPKVPDYGMTDGDWATLGGGLVVLLAVGGGVFFIRRRRKSPKGDDENDEDGDGKGDSFIDDEDGEDGDGNAQDRKSKKGLGSFFSRFKKKSAAKDEDDEDEDGSFGAAKDKPARPGKKPKK